MRPPTDAAPSARRRLLLSANARDALAPVLRDLPQIEVVLLGDAAEDPACAVDAAYVSRDVTGLSTKHTVQEPLAGCYRVLRRSPRLAWVHTHSAGADRPIYGELLARGVAVTTSAGANATVVAQTALGAVLAIARRLPRAWAAQARGEWSPLVAGPLPDDLAGQTAVVVGYGAIGRTLVPWLAMLGLRVVVVRHGPEPVAGGVETLRHGELHRVLPRAQWLVLACPLSAETERLVDAEALALLPSGAVLVNVARGELCDEAALIAALRDGRLGGAFLDVFEHEPLPTDSPLWTLPNVLVSPHSAGHSAGNAARWTAIFAGNLGRWARGEPLLNRVHAP